MLLVNLSNSTVTGKPSDNGLANQNLTTIDYPGLILYAIIFEYKIEFKV